MSAWPSTVHRTDTKRRLQHGQQDSATCQPSNQNIRRDALQGLPLPGLRSRAEPAVVLLNSQHIQAGASGWWDGTHLRLHKPLTATLDYTPAVTKWVLPSSPALQHAPSMLQLQRAYRVAAQTLWEIRLEKGKSSLAERNSTVLYLHCMGNSDPSL